MTPVEAVRLKTGDKSLITREIAIGDGVKTVFKLGHENLASLQIWVNQVLQVEPAQYVADVALGTVTFTAAPGINIEVIFQYYWTQFSDDEVEYFLTEAGDSITLASSLLLYALAADAAKVAMRETLAGGGSFGSVTRDTSLTAQELRETANALKKLYDETASGAEFPAQSLTEVAWTNQVAEELLEQELIRGL